MFEIMQEKIRKSYTNPILIHIFENIFPQIKVKKITLNKTMCNLFGITTPSHEITHTANFNMIGDEILLDGKMDYFKTVRYELAKSYTNDIPFPIHFLSLKDTFDTMRPALIH